MGKKNKKQPKNDARGYSQGACESSDTVELQAPPPTVVAPCGDDNIGAVDVVRVASLIPNEPLVDETGARMAVTSPSQSSTTTTKHITAADHRLSTSTISVQQSQPISHDPQIPLERTTTTTTTNATTLLLEDLFQKLRQVHDQILKCSTTTTSSTTTSTNLPSDIRSATTTFVGSQAKRRTRAQKLWRDLTELGFSRAQIESLVTAQGLGVTLPQALDWLCGRYADHELPRLFIEETTSSSSSSSIFQKHNIRSIRTPASSENHLTVVVPSSHPSTTTTLPTMETDAGKNDDDDNPRQHSFDPDLPSSFSTSHPFKSRSDRGNPRSSDGGPGENDSGDDEDDNNPENAEKRAWLLEQFAYERDDEDGTEDFGSSTTLQDPTPEVTATNATTVNQTITTTTETTTIGDQPSLLPLLERLDAVRRQWAQQQADLNNEANNYMRSKQERKQLQKQVQTLRQQVTTLERQIEKARKQQQQIQLSTTTKNDEDGDVDIPEEKDNCGGAFLFGDDQSETSSCSATKAKTVEQSIVASGDTNAATTTCAVDPAAASGSPWVFHKNSNNIPDIPSNWTGQTPKAILEDYCRKEKLRFGRPTFEKLSQKGCRVRVPLVQLHRKPKDGSTSSTSTSNCLEAVSVGPSHSYPNAQQYVSVQLLFQLIHGDNDKTNNTSAVVLPLYRLFPPYYRSLWLSWLDESQQEQRKHDQVVEQIRQDQIDRLLQLADVWSSTANSPSVINDSPEISTTIKPVTTPALTTWEDTTSTVTIPTRYPDVVFPSRTVVPPTPTTKGQRMQKEFFTLKGTARYQHMQTDRMRLPIHAFHDVILDTIQNNPVTILCAETGSGKTTQCSSYILEKALSEGVGDQIFILCSQPRRVAAMSVAERVADELVTDLGKLVGYQIRLEARRTAETRLLFCTTGVVLRRLMEDPTLEGITHVVVDEVHERQWQVDVLLVALRALLNGKRPDLKVILMSATLDTELFGSFFFGGPVINVPGRTFPVSTYYLEDLLEKTKHLIDEGSRCARRDHSSRETVSLWVSGRGGEKRRETADYQMNDHVSNEFSTYAMTTRLSMDRVDETVLNYDLIEDVLESLVGSGDCPFKPSEKVGTSRGAILIFLPGIGEIRSLMERLSGSRHFGNTHKFEIIPMHSSLSSNDQRRAFKPPPAGCRKIIIATNIAETSITIPDVVFVIDCGRVKEIQRDQRTGTRKLVSTWCSRANAKQRAGRAGRVQPGICLKLYSSRTEMLIMKSVNEPEIRRIPLEEVCLTILAAGFAESCSDFLSQTPQPPSDDSVRAALSILQGIGAVVSKNSTDGTRRSGSTEYLTGLGRHLAKLPVDVRVGKMLIYGTIFKCTDAMLTIAACLSASKSPFAAPFHDMTQAKAAHAKFAHPNSDFMTLLNVWNAYIQAGVMARTFCKEMFLNFSSLNEIQDARTHYLDLLCSQGFVDRQKLGRNTQKRSIDENALISGGYCQNSRIEEVVHAVLCAGLFPNVAYLNKSATAKETTLRHKSETLLVRSSVNSKVDTRLAPSEWLTFFEKFGTERRVSISKTAFVPPLCLMMFGSDLVVLHTKRRVSIDGWIELSVAAKTAVIFREIRALFDSFLVAVFEDARSVALRNVLDAVVEDLVKLLVAQANVN